MRHKPFICHWYKKITITKPYDLYKNFGSKPTPERTYVKLLEYIKDHPWEKAAEIRAGLGFKSTSFSSYFASLLFLDWIDYDKQYRYVIRPNGLAILKKAING